MRRWLLGFAALFAVLASWSLASPLYSGPDEPAHVVQAAGLVRGELLGRDAGGPATVVTVPAWLAHANVMPNCFNGRPSMPASCEPPVPSKQGTVSSTTYTGRYPPLYGFVVGWPTLIASGATALRLMRLAGVAVCAALLAGAGCCALRARRKVGLLVGLALSVTPQSAFLGGVVNESGLEICSAICVWAAGLVVAEQLADRPRRADRTALAWLTVSAVIMANSEGLAPALLAVIGVVLIAAAGRDGARAFLRSRAGRASVAAVLAGVAVAVAWIVAAGGLRVRPSRVALPAGGAWSAFVHTAANIVSMVPQYLGNFGWVDTPLPVPVYVVGLAVAAGLVVFGVARAGPRERRLAVAVLLVCAAVPLVLTYSQASKLGEFGQARDWMPLWVGLPLMACRAIDGRRARAVLAAAGIGALALQVAAWSRLLQRFGLGHGLARALGAWSPPLPWLGLLALLVAGLVALAWGGWVAATRSAGPTPTAAPALAAAENGGPGPDAYQRPAGAGRRNNTHSSSTNWTTHSDP